VKIPNKECACASQIGLFYAFCPIKNPSNRAMLIESTESTSRSSLFHSFFFKKNYIFNLALLHIKRTVLTPESQRNNGLGGIFNFWFEKNILR
jgi:hypothetical protein